MLFHRRQLLVTLFIAGLSVWTLAASPDEVFHNLPDLAKPWSPSRNEPEHYGKVWWPGTYNYQDFSREVSIHLAAIHEKSPRLPLSGPGGGTSTRQ